MKKTILLLLLFSLIISCCTHAFAADISVSASSLSSVRFPDVNETSEEGIAVYSMVDAGVINGFPDGTFGPNKLLTRAQAAKIINQEFGFSETSSEGFSDVKGKEWFANHALIAKKAGYIKGYSDGTFREGRNITRQEVCVILVRIFNALGVEMTALPLTVDVTDTIAGWAKDDVMLVLTNGFMTTDDTGAFRASYPITRGEFCILLAKFLDIGDHDDALEDTTSGSGDSTIGNNNDEATAVSSIQSVYTALLSSQLGTKIESLDTEYTVENHEIQKMVEYIRNCLFKVLADDAAGKIISPQYVTTTYASEISSVQGYWGSLNPAAKSDLISAFGSYLTADDIEVLREYFSI